MNPNARALCVVRPVARTWIVDYKPEIIYPVNPYSHGHLSQSFETLVGRNSRFALLHNSRIVLTIQMEIWKNILF